MNNFETSAIIVGKGRGGVKVGREEIISRASGSGILLLRTRVNCARRLIFILQVVSFSSSATTNCGIS